MSGEQVEVDQVASGDCLYGNIDFTSPLNFKLGATSFHSGNTDMQFFTNRQKKSDKGVLDYDPLDRALKKIESYSYEQLAAHILATRATGYTGAPLFSEDLRNLDHISVQVFFETDDENPDVRAIISHSKPNFWSHLFPRSTSALIKSSNNDT